MPTATVFRALLFLACGALAHAAEPPANVPAPRNDRNSQIAHEQLLEKAKKGRIDVYFIGDSITRRWGATDPQYHELLENWRTNFFGWNAADFGWGADRIENMLWRLEHGELDGVNPKIIVILAGINNVGKNPGEGAAENIERGIQALSSGAWTPVTTGYPTGGAADTTVTFTDNVAGGSNFYRVSTP